LVAANFI